MSKPNTTRRNTPTEKKNARTTKDTTTRAKPARRSRPPTNPFFTKIPANPDALHAWIAKYLNVRIARTPLIEGHAAPFDYLIHTFFEGAFRRGIGLPADAFATTAQAQQPRTSSRKSRASKSSPSSSSHSSSTSPPHSSPDCTVWANRGGGKTYLAAIATLLDLLFKTKCQVRILAGSIEQGRRMHEHLRSFLDRDELDHITARITTRRISIPAMKSAVEILAASQTSVRGTRVQKLSCDEVDLFDPELWSAAQLVTRSLPNTPGPWGDTIRGSVEALSTMHKPFGLMWKLVGDPGKTDSPLSTQRALSKPEGECPDPNAAGGANHNCLSVPTSPASLTALSALSGESSSFPSHSPRTLFRWGLLDVLEHCPPERSCSTCPLEPECQGRAKFTPLTCEGHITIDDASNMKFRVGRETWESEMLCLRPSRSSSVYPEFNPAIHVRPWHGPPGPCSNSSSSSSPPSEFSHMIAGMDFGYRGETVILLAGITHSGRVHIIREHCKCEEILDRHIDALDRWRVEGLFRHHTELGDAPPLEFIGIDPAGNAPDQQTGDTNADCLKKRGYLLRSRKSDIYPGLTIVRDRLTPAWSPSRSAWGPSQFRGNAFAVPREPGPQLLIDPACTRLIECLTGYHFDESKPESIEPKKDGYDHACDALRYMLVNHDRPYKSECRNYAGGAA